MRAIRHAVPIALAALLLAACQQPDVGQPCDGPQGNGLDLKAPGGGPLDQNLADGRGCSSDGADYFKTGVTRCENLVCIRSSTGACAADPGLLAVRYYCSKPCVSDGDCFESETGLVCRQVVLDPNFLASLPPDVRQRYLGDIQSSSFCATPAP